MKTVVMDSQILNTVQQCGFKTDLTFNRNLRPLTKESFFDDGDLVHEMFAIYYKGIMEGLPYEQRVEKANTLGLEHAATLDILMSDAEETMMVTNEYFEHFKNEDVKVLAVEHPFAFILGEDAEDDIRVVYVGKIDLVTQLDAPYMNQLLNLEADPKILPWDHKTAKQRKAPHPLSNQFIGYCRALDVNEFQVNKIAFIKDEDKFKRYQIPYSDGVIKRWEANTMWWAKQYAYYIETGTWPQNFTSCDKYSGCAFSEICNATSMEVMEHTMHVMFKVVEPWDVSKILGDSSKVNQALVTNAFESAPAEDRAKGSPVES
jgi:hypothetical protein